MISTTKSPAKIGLIIGMIFMTAQIKAATYSTLTDGNWNDVTAVWSLDGVTPCACTPGASSAGNDIIVNNNLVMNYNLVFNAGSNITFAPGSSLNGPFNINIWNANLDIFGNLSLSRYTQDFNTNVVMHPGAIMTLGNRYVLADGIFTMDGALLYMTGGNFENKLNGSFFATNASRVNVAVGNIDNDGFIFIEAGSCMTANGNWKNNATGTVSGSGSVTTNVGNIQNDGIWDVALLWCSAGSDFGMPSPENCAGAMTTCNGIALPVDLISFAAAFQEDYVNVSWATASETDNDHFVVLHSMDGKDWNEVALIDGMGNSSELKEYSIQHFDYKSGINYYQLVQVDFDGRENYSDVVSVKANHEDDQLLVYPNPAISGSSVTVKNIGSAGGTLFILNTSGRTVKQIPFSAFTDVLNIELYDLTPGIYLLSAELSDKSKMGKLIIK